MGFLDWGTVEVVTVYLSGYWFFCRTFLLMLSPRNPSKSIMLAWYAGVSYERLGMSRKPAPKLPIPFESQPQLPLSLRLLHDLRVLIDIEVLAHLEERPEILVIAYATEILP